MQIKVTKTCEHNLPVPKQQSPFAAGFDLHYCDVEGEGGKTFLLRNEQKTFATGYAFEIPARYAGFIWPRSGMAAKFGVQVMAGLIDADYRGEIKVILFGTTERPVEITHGDRIAQLVISPVVHATCKLEEKLQDSSRGIGGFGSTGK